MGTIVKDDTYEQLTKYKKDIIPIIKRNKLKSLVDEIESLEKKSNLSDDEQNELTEAKLEKLSIESRFNQINELMTNKLPVLNSVESLSCKISYDSPLEAAKVARLLLSKRTAIRQEAINLLDGIHLAENDMAEFGMVIYKRKVEKEWKYFFSEHTMGKKVQEQNNTTYFVTSLNPLFDQVELDSKNVIVSDIHTHPKNPIVNPEGYKSFSEGDNKEIKGDLYANQLRAHKYPEYIGSFVVKCGDNLNLRDDYLDFDELTPTKKKQFYRRIWRGVDRMPHNKLPKVLTTSYSFDSSEINVGGEESVEMCEVGSQGQSNAKLFPDNNSYAQFSTNISQAGHADPLSMDGSLFRNVSGLGDAPAIVGGLVLEQGNAAGWFHSFSEAGELQRAA